MLGLAVILFASKKGEAAVEKQYDSSKEKYYNEGTKVFIENIKECIKEGKMGLEFIDKYSDSKKIVYSLKPLKYFKDLNLKIFVKPEVEPQ